ncbi:MAG: hypothetical protein D6687_06475 [Acidobacteria bacterium]|nr:MAG: hypothetical protein D6687_06475 [Acidobacteriota bacterium]
MSFIRKLLLVFCVLLIASNSIFPQDQRQEKKQDTNQRTKFFDPNSTNPEEIADSVILVYGLFAGFGGFEQIRERFAQIRRTTVETGKITVTKDPSNVEVINYTQRIIRGENLEKERIRTDIQSPTFRYSLVYNQGEIFGILGESIFSPRAEIVKEFESRIWHGLDALLRYKENGSTVSLAGKEKNLGVELIHLDVTDKKNRKTRFFISAKTFRVLWLEYEEDGIKYRRKFYDHKITQGTLVPYRSVLYAGDKQIEEVNILTVTFGQKVDESLFQKQ